MKKCCIGNIMSVPTSTIVKNYNEIGFDMKAIEAEMSILHMMIQIHCFVSMVCCYGII